MLWHRSGWRGVHRRGCRGRGTGGFFEKSLRKHMILTAFVSLGKVFGRQFNRWHGSGHCGIPTTRGGRAAGNLLCRVSGAMGEIPLSASLFWQTVQSRIAVERSEASTSFSVLLRFLASFLADKNAAKSRLSDFVRFVSPLVYSPVQSVEKAHQV